MRDKPVLGCGSCNLCCTLLRIDMLGKPAQMTCWHTTIHGGCAVHDQKATDPTLAACHQFRCIWLESQYLDDDDELGRTRAGRDMRPDQTHVVLGPPDPTDPKHLYVNVDPAHRTAWRAPKVMAYLDEVVSKGGTITVIVGDQHFEYHGRD